MKNLVSLVSRHWQAKLISLVLALLVWAVVQKSVQRSPEATGSPSRFRFEGREPAAEKFDFSKKP
jgi:hypothetical protein